MRVLLPWLRASLMGALVMFAWGAFAHMLLLKGAGFARLDQEDAVITELARDIGREGLYFFPSLDFERTSTPAENAAWEAKFARGPTGLVLFHPAGDAPVSLRKLTRQFLSEWLAALVVVWVLSLVVAPYWKRVLLTGALGAFACLSVSALYWTWYGFPTAFFLAQCVDKVLGWTLAGALIARRLPG
ncbi:MAG: hypothetical protein QM778_12310 [Myxococcales bacterium]